MYIFVFPLKELTSMVRVLPFVPATTDTLPGTTPRNSFEIPMHDLPSIFPPLDVF